MPEIALVYPNLVESPRRFVANAETNQWQAQRNNGDDDGTTASSSSSPSSTSHHHHHHSMEESLPGSSSISSFSLGGETVVVTTCASVTNSDTLCIAMTTNEALESPITAELNVQDLQLGPLVAVKTFPDTNKRLKMTMIDCQ